MGLRSGYKQTEVGELPSSWEIVPLGKLLEFRNGVNADKAAYGRGVRFINVLEVITKSHLRASDIPGRITLPEQAITSYEVRPGDIVFNRTSETQGEIGLAAVYTDNEQVVFGGFVIRGRFESDADLDGCYSGYALRSPHIRLQMVARGQGAIRANIGQQDLRTVLVPRPPLNEQLAIAVVLRDVDALLDALDRLIAKKRDLKQAAMQQLLTGQIRLPGFELRSSYKHTEVGLIPADWEVRPLLSAVRIANGQVDPRNEPYRSMTLVAPDHIESATGCLLARESAASQKAISGKYLFSRGDVVYSKIRPYLRKAFLAQFDGLCSADMYPLKPIGGVSAGFMLAVLLGHRFSKFAESVSVRSGMPKINRAELAEYNFAYPPPPEQHAIAAVFADMDVELALLEQRRDKTRLLKQGMMQELLTGRTRLV